jgi:hypothetical protein
MTVDPQDIPTPGGWKYLVFGIGIIVGSSLLIGIFSFAWQVSLQLNSSSQTLSELKKDYEANKIETNARLRDLETNRYSTKP